MSAGERDPGNHRCAQRDTCTLDAACPHSWECCAAEVSMPILWARALFALYEGWASAPGEFRPLDEAAEAIAEHEDELRDLLGLR